MTNVVIHEVPDTVVTTHHPAERAVVCTWSSFRTGVVIDAIRGAAQAAARVAAKTIIVDVSSNVGIMTKSDRDALANLPNEVPELGNCCAIINVVGADTVTQIGARQWLERAQVTGIAVYECTSLADALVIAGKIAGGQQ